MVVKELDIDKIFMTIDFEDPNFSGLEFNFIFGISDLFDPISVRKINEKAYELIEGKRRYIISKILKLKTILVKVLNNKDIADLNKSLEDFYKDPPDRDKLVKYLSNSISDCTLKKIIKNPEIMNQHHGFGTYVRNLIRKSGFEYDTRHLDFEWKGLITRAISLKVNEAINRELIENGYQYGRSSNSYYLLEWKQEVNKDE